MIIKTVQLKNLTSIHLKGKIDVGFIEKDIDCNDAGFVIGQGSNMLIKKTKMLYKLSDKFNYIHLSNLEGILIIGGATKIRDVVKYSIVKGFSCLEFLAGIPASIGGTIFMNAGAFGYEVSDTLKYIKIFEHNRGIRTIENFNFSYRNSGLKGIVLEAGFKFKRDNSENLRRKVAEFIKTRLKTAHMVNTFGSVFKNPSKDMPAGKLIEICGLKGLRKKTAMISPKHGNYIIGSALTDVDDVLFLIDKAKNEVFKRFSIELVEEVIIV